MFQVLDDNNRNETTFVVREQPEDMSILNGYSMLDIL